MLLNYVPGVSCLQVEFLLYMCVFCRLSVQWCCKLLNSFKTAACVIFWHALNISSLLSVPELFIVKTDVGEEAKKKNKEPTNNIKEEYVFIALVVIRVINNTIWCFSPKINFLEIYNTFSPVRLKYWLQFAFFLITSEAEHFLSMCLLLFRWNERIYFVHYWFWGFLYTGCSNKLLVCVSCLELLRN